MKITSIQVGPIMTNCYLLCDETAGVCALIDPGDDAARVARLVEQSGCTLQYILLTHGHFDHTSAVRPLLEQYPDVPVYIHEKDAVVNSTDGSTKTKLDAYQSPAKAVLMLDATVTDNNGGLTPEPDDGQDPCGKDGCRTIDLTVQKVWKDGNLERPQSVELKIAAHYTDGSGNTVTPQTIQCFGADCTTVTQKNPWTVTLDSSDASSWSNTWRKVIQGLPVAFVDGQDANGKDIVRYYTYTVEETAVTYKDGDTTKTIKPAEAGYQVSVSYNTKERVAIVTNAALLPDTGGAGTMWFLMFGLLLMGAGVVWYVRNQRVQFGTVRSGSSRIRKRGAHAS